ncbi:ATP-binding protein [Silvibacterium acidisoli]|uniref:ATP-binding protein n=1 Tax=Acidobacteriaceae bacterium ZG23-2 TaxID=2883246 RepID=UPI00406CD4AB
MRHFGSFRLDTQNECLWQGDERLALTPRPFSVLRYLVENPDRLVTHDELLEALWPETYVQPQVLRTYVLELRKLLGDDLDSPRYIQTVPKRGYRFVAAVTEPVEGSAGSHESPAQTASIFGRDAELAALHQKLERVRKGERLTLFLTGEAGIGKTALLDAFCMQLCAVPQLRIARGQSLEGFGGKESFYPVREAVNELCCSNDEKARALLSAAAPGWFSHGVPGVPLIGEISEALESLSQAETLLLIFEDIHWADDSTLNLISALARRRGAAKLMLLASFRQTDLTPEHPLSALEQDLISRRGGEKMRLGPIGKDAVSAYLRRELEAEKLPSGLSSLVHQHSSGNPLFMTAVLDHLRTQQIVSSKGGEVTLKMPLEEIEPGVPDGLSDLIGLQLERLSEEDRRLLEAGCISGSIFPAWAAAAALGRELDEVEEAYSRLTRRVRLISIAGEDELPGGSFSTFYVFSHALYREVLYAQIPPARRSQWHLRVAGRLREMFAGQEANVEEEIMAHTEAGQQGRLR